MTSLRAALLAPALLVACSGRGVDTGDTDGIPELPRLAEGTYDGATIAMDSTCGTVTDGVFGLFEVDYVSDTAFNLNGTTQEVCETASGAVVCGETSWGMYYGSSSTLMMLAITTDVQITSTTSFLHHRTAVGTCEGELCDEYATHLGATWPCALDLDESYVQPDVEDRCSDEVDNDRDGLVDGYDDDCPGLVPYLWAVSGEFGYGAASDAIVPFVVDGVEHPPKIVIRIRSRIYAEALDDAEICSIALTYSGSDPLPRLHDAWTYSNDDYVADGFVMPPDAYTIETDCRDKDMDESGRVGTIEEIAAAALGTDTPGWIIGVGTLDPTMNLPNEALLDEARYAGGMAGLGVLTTGIDSYGYSVPLAVDADMHVLNASGGAATSAEFALQTPLQLLDPATVTDAGPLPTGAYLVEPWFWRLHLN